jgi:predicted porin
VDVEVDGTDIDVESDDSTSGFAWQLVAGSDYYFNEKFSAFLEYKYLNYESDGDVFGEGRIDQHIIALGLRLHF